ncbi:MAG: hypothetical protein BWZ07_02956 [Alphaproteobacteria bacterium ADurb.BinA280]|nr:MAG: hypothetical protein BWZ07_02956 [Alphaproteobacteria bacterium ADurb.BinA280]
MSSFDRCEGHTKRIGGIELFAIKPPHDAIATSPRIAIRIYLHIEGRIQQ